MAICCTYLLLCFSVYSSFILLILTDYKSDNLVKISNGNDNNFHLKNKHLVTVTFHNNSINSYSSTSL